MEPCNLVYLEYNTSRTGMVVYADGKRYPLITSKQKQYNSILEGAEIVTRHSDGSSIALVASKLVNDGIAASSYVESDMGSVTEVLGVAASTLSAWVTGELLNHPATRLARFAPGGDVHALTDIVGTIFDPAWYPPPPNRPDRNSALEARFGLTPRWDEGTPSTFRTRLTAAWRAADKPTDADFFTRKFDEMVVGGVRPTVAERRMGKYFLKCLVAVWGDTTRPKGSEPFFDPKHLFDARSLGSVGTRI